MLKTVASLLLAALATFATPTLASAKPTDALTCRRVAVNHPALDNYTVDVCPRP